MMLHNQARLFFAMLRSTPPKEAMMAKISTALISSDFSRKRRRNG